MSDALVVAKGLTRRFGDFTAVDHVSFTLESGEVLGYLGPNGSGKTTTMRMLLGILEPSEGEAQVLGYDVLKDPDKVRNVVGYMSQKFALYNEMTVWENLSFYAGVYGVRNVRRVSEMLSLMGLERVRDVRADALPTGWRQRLALGVAIVHRPRLLFLDEPTAGVDPNTRREFWDLIYSLVDQGMSAFVTTHYMDEAERCTRVGIMRQGKLLAVDTPTNLKRKSLQGMAWDVFAEPLLPALRVLEKVPGVQRAGLVGDHLRAITTAEVDARTMRHALRANQIQVRKIANVEPTLEDVFLALAEA